MAQGCHPETEPAATFWPPAAAAGPAGAGRVFTARALALGVGCVAFLSVVTPYTYLVVRGSELAANHLPAGTMVVFLLLVVVNGVLVRRLRARWGLTRGELLLIYVMMLVASAIPARAFLAYVLSVPAGGFYYASPENRWGTLLLPYMKPWLAPRGQETIKYFFEGLPAGRAIPWREWLAPMIAWGLFFLLFVGTSMSLALLVRSRWVQDERLTFPLAQIPLDLAGGEERPHGLGAGLRSPALLLGFAAALLIQVLLGAPRYYPNLAPINILKIPLVSGATRLPLSNLEGTSLHFNPSAVGIGFLLNADVGLSIWLFWLITKIELYLIGYYGASSGASAGGVHGIWIMQIFARGQQVGAFYLIAALMVWELRTQVAGALRGACGRGALAARRASHEGAPPTPQQQRELRWGFWGLVGGLALMTVWCVAAGMTPLYALAALVLYLIIALVLARLVAQAGVFFAAWAGEFLPADMLAYPLGMAAIPKSSAFVIYLQQAILLNDRRTITMPFLTDALKIGTAERMPLLRLCAAMLGSVVIAVCISYVMGLLLFYRHGAATLWVESGQHIPMWNFNRLKDRWQAQLEPNWYFVWWNVFGAATMYFLVSMQRKFLWWRLSPVGYLMGQSPSLEQIAGPFFIGWLASWLVTRYTTLKVYRAVRPFFVGLVVGEFAGVALWLVVDAITGVTGHTTFPEP